MLEFQNKQLNKTVELIEFYNRALALPGHNDENHLSNLVEELAEIFIAKVDDFRNNKIEDCSKLRINGNDCASISAFSISCLKFFKTATIELQDGDIAVINEFGIITSFAKNTKTDYIGHHITELINNTNDTKAGKHYENIKTQNILASKIYSLVEIKIRRKDYAAGEFFAAIHSDIINHESFMNKEQTAVVRSRIKHSTK